jgi:hypothetical protein
MSESPVSLGQQDRAAQSKVQRYCGNCGLALEKVVSHAGFDTETGDARFSIDMMCTKGHAVPFHHVGEIVRPALPGEFDPPKKRWWKRLGL